MRISFNLQDLSQTSLDLNAIGYDPADNTLVFTNDHGIYKEVVLDGYDFTLHEKRELPFPAPLYRDPAKESLLQRMGHLVQGEVLDTGISLSPEQLVELIDAAREV